MKTEITFSGFHGRQHITSHITAHTTGPDFCLTTNSMQQNLLEELAIPQVVTKFPKLQRTQ